MLEVALLAWDRANAGSFNIIEQIGGAEAAQVYFHLMKGKHLAESDVAPLLFSAEEVQGGVWPDLVDLTAGLSLHSPALRNALCDACENQEDVYQFFEPRWQGKPEGAPAYKI